MLRLYRFFIHPFVFWSLTIILCAMSLSFILPLPLLIAKQFRAYAIPWMFVCLGLAMIFLIISQKKLMYVAIACCAAMALFLLNSFNTNIKLANHDNLHSISIAFINPSISNGHIQQIIQQIQFTQADLVVVEEFTPEWMELGEWLSSNYSFSMKEMRIDPLGKAIFSKFNFTDQNIYKILQNPVLSIGLVSSANDSFKIFASNSLPPVTMNGYQKLKIYLDSLAHTINSFYGPRVLCADLNIVPWSSELLQFKSNTDFNSSRRDNTQGLIQNSLFGIFNTPKNEIMYSKNLECSWFQVMEDGDKNPFGIFGRYQLKF